MCLLSEKGIDNSTKNLSCNTNSHQKHEKCEYAVKIVIGTSKNPRKVKTAAEDFQKFKSLTKDLRL